MKASQFKVGDECVFHYGPAGWRFSGRIMEAVVTRIEGGVVYVNYKTDEFGHSLTEEYAPSLDHLYKSSKLQRVLR